jgi:CheY-like chemotaxis protein
MSGYAQEKIEPRHLAVSRTGFLQKPFTARDLALRVRDLLGGAPSKPPSILVVDDEASVRGFFREVLKNAGYEVDEAGDGREAEDRLALGGVDLVLTDLIMPNQEGIETIRMLRKQNPEIGIIAVSGTRWTAFLDIALALGADAALAKPVEATKLREEVTRVLAIRRRLPERRE